MRKRSVILFLALALVLGALLIPKEEEKTEKVIHQHAVWVQEDPAVTGLGPDGVLTSHLPILLIEADGNAFPGQSREDKRRLLCRYSIFWEEGEMNRSDGTPSQEGTLAISIRGNSSRDFPKKQYGLRLVDGEGETVKESLLGMPAESTWVLNGSFIDHSLIRNYMLYNLAGELFDYAPRCRLCEVLITNADREPVYQGVYTLIEKIKVSENRLDLSDYDPSYPETPFLLQLSSPIDHLAIEHITTNYAYLHPFDLEYPKEEELTEESLHYIETEVLRLEKLLYDANRTGNWEKVLEVIDLNNFIDYYLYNEFFQNYDAGRRSTYLYKEVGGKFRLGPVWDFDGALDNFNSMTIPFNELRRQFVYSYLSQCPEYVHQSVARYRELRRGLLSDENLLAYIDGAGAYLGSAAERNSKLWYGAGDIRFQSELDRMKDLIVRRGAWLDEKFESVSAVIE